METSISPLAVEIFAAAKSARPKSVFLCEGPEDTVLSVGPHRTNLFHYQIDLDCGDKLVQLSSNDHTPISILLDQRKNGAVRMVIYSANESPIEFDGTVSTPNPLMGHVLIKAHESNGPGQAVIHATFAGDGDASLLIDSSPELLRHLEVNAKAWRAKGGGADRVDIFQSEGSFNLGA